MNKRKCSNRMLIPMIGIVATSVVLLISLYWIVLKVFAANAEPIEQNLSVVGVTSTTTFETTETTTQTTTISTTVTIPSETLTSTTTTAEITTTAEATIEETTQETIEETTDETNEIDLSNLYISVNMNLNETTGMSKEQFISLMNNFSYDYNGLFDRNAGLIWDLCQENQINEIFFISLIGAESAWGSNESHVAACNYTSIKPEGYLLTYSSEYEGLMASAKLIGDKYFNNIGTTLYSISEVYCPDNPETIDIDESQYWIELVYDCMSLVVSDIQSN